MNVGIIGAGGIAQKLHLPELTALPDVRVTHLAGRKPHRLRLLAEQHDVPNWTTDYADLLADDGLDAIVVALPHPLHVPVGLQALAAGKHLLVQKPLCADMAEADAFVAAAEKSDRIVYCLPHVAPEVAVCHRLVTEGAIGKLSGAYCRVSHGGPEVYYAEIRDHFGEGSSRGNSLDEADTADNKLWFFEEGVAAVGALFDMGVYAVATLVAVMGSVRSVIGQTTTRDKPTTLEDTATLLLEFASGALGTAETGWCDPARTWQLSVHGTHGKLCAPGQEGTMLTRWEPGSYTREDTPAIPYAIDLTNYPGENAHQEWVRCIREGKSPEFSSARTARHITEILLAGLESARTGQRIAVASTL